MSALPPKVDKCGLSWIARNANNRHSSVSVLLFRCRRFGRTKPYYRRGQPDSFLQRDTSAASRVLKRSTQRRLQNG